MLKVWSTCSKIMKKESNVFCKAYSTSMFAKSKLLNSEWHDAKPYSDIPGPTKFQLIKEYRPGGKFHGLTINQFYTKLYTEYGTLAKVPGIFGRSDLIFSYDPIHYEKVIRNEGTYPHRNGLQTMEYYRRNNNPDIYGDVTGLVTDQGENWWKIRSTVNPIMIHPNTIKMYIQPVDLVAKDFIKKIKLLRNASNEMPENFINEIQKWGLESIGIIAVDKRLGLMWDSGKSHEIDQLLMAVQTFFKLTYEVEIELSLWKYYETKKFKQLMAAHDTITKVLLKCVDEAIIHYENSSHGDNKELSVLQQMLKINRKYAIVMVIDMLIGGIDTTTSALASLLYHLAKNPEKQEVLREEVNNILPYKSSMFNKEDLNNIPYLRACLKESMRLSPIIVGQARTADKDIVLNGYQVPKNTEVIMGYSVLLRHEKYFPQSQSYIPERWLKSNNTELKLTNAFVYLPFGIGVRSCIGRRLAEMEVFIMTSRILKEFRVEWNYGPVEYSGLINSPSSALKYTLINI